ncbi:4948_t:CDS:2, partial [Scutellospora calospora]
KYYYIFSIGLALLLSLLPAVNNLYGYNYNEKNCWYRNSGQKDNVLWEWLTLFGWVALSVLYCAIVVIWVFIKLYSVTRKIDKTFECLQTSQLSDTPTLINKTVISSVVKRVILYPVVPLITQSCSIFQTCAYLYNVFSFTLYLLCFMGISIQGFAKAIVFSQDIAVTRAFQAVKLHFDF